MSSRLTLDAALSGRVASRRVRPCLTTRACAQESHAVRVDAINAARQCAATLLVSAGLLCTQSLAPEPVLARADAEQVAVGAATARTVRTPQPAPQLPLPPLASTGAAAAAAATASGAAGAALLVEEAEELVLDVVHFFQHSVEAVESTVHHLQVVHTLERLEGMPLNQVVDLRVLKAAMHPVSEQVAVVDEVGEEPVAEAPVPAAVVHLDMALDEVAEWRLRDVVDVGKLADALQDVQFSGPLESRALQREALRLRRTVHWEAVLEAVRPPALRQALTELGSHSGGRPFADMDIRAAVSAVRLDAVREVLSPPKSERGSAGHSLESSGMWTWESV